MADTAVFVLTIALVWLAVSLVALAASSMAILFLSGHPTRAHRARRVFALVHGFRPLGRDGLVFQHTAGCGVACHHMLLRDFGIDEAPDDDAFEVTSEGVSMTAIVDALVRRGLSARGVIFEPFGQLRHFQQRGGVKLMLLLDAALPHGWLAPVIGPAWKLARALARGGLHPRHWVYLEACTDDGVVVRDPLYGRIGIPRRRFSKLWTGLAVVASAGEGMTESARHAYRSAG